jgi:hypothetical protein
MRELFRPLVRWGTLASTLAAVVSVDRRLACEHHHDACECERVCACLGVAVVSNRKEKATPVGVIMGASA